MNHRIVSDTFEFERIFCSTTQQQLRSYQDGPMNHRIVSECALNGGALNRGFTIHGSSCTKGAPHLLVLLFTHTPAMPKVLLKGGRRLMAKWCDVTQNSPHPFSSLPCPVITDTTSTWWVLREQIASVKVVTSWWPQTKLASGDSLCCTVTTLRGECSPSRVCTYWMVR